MAKFLTVPKTRLDLAKILMSNDYNINETISDLESLLDLDESKKDCLHATLRRIRDTARKAKKSLDIWMVLGGILKFFWSLKRQNYQFLFPIFL